MRENDRLTRALDMVDEDLIERAAPGAYRKKTNKRPWYKGNWIRVAAAACLALCLISGAVAAIIVGTGDPTVPPITQPGVIEGGEYDDIANKLESLRNDDVSDFNGLFAPPSAGENGGEGEGDENVAKPSGGSVTIMGGREVIDLGSAASAPDTVQVSDSHIFALSGGSLLVYSLAGEESALVGEYSRSGDPEALFLSADGKRLTLITSEAVQVCVQVLDVSDPANMTELHSFKATGRYCAARQVNGKLMLVLGNSIFVDPDYKDTSTFVPHYDTGNGMSPISATDIHYPEKLNSTDYTVLYQLNGEALAMEGSVALLSYDGRIYLTADGAFVTRSFVQYKEAEGRTTAHAMLEIARVGFDGPKPVYKGSVAVDGILQDRYGFDVSGGMLRVGTTTREVLCSETVNGTVIQREPDYSNKTNAGLFCIDLATMRIAGRLTGFAADGAAVQTVRFAGSKVYMETADNAIFCLDTTKADAMTVETVNAMAGRDPVLFAFGDGYFLGIGKGTDGMLKVVVYAESVTGLSAVCSYTRTALCASDAATYFIDPDRGLIGLVLNNPDEAIGTEYLLLQFNGEALVPLFCESFHGFYREARSFVVGGYAYVISRGLTVFALSEQA